MVFNNVSGFLALFILIWLVVLTFLVFRMISHYNNLARGATKISLKEVLDSLLREQTISKKRLNHAEEEINETKELIKTNIQKIGIVRFNPFSDTGGSQSFSLVLLDAHDNGIVMTSLYARSGNRWYVKEIKGGKGVTLELSKEESLAVKKAQPTLLV